MPTERESLPPIRRRVLGEVFLVALRLGLTSFGGPIAHLGYFREEYVVRRRWLDDRAFGELLALCQFLPGPASSQLGFAIGWARAGAGGALAAWLAFTLPSALLMLAWAWAATMWRGPLAESVIHGLKIAAVAVVAQAVVAMARNLTPDPPRMAIAAGAATAVLLLAGQPAVQILAIAAGALAGLALRPAARTAIPTLQARAPSARVGLTSLAVFAGLLVVLPLLAPTSGWLGLAEVFYRAGALVFGGGHVVLPLLREGLVPGWIGDDAFLSGYGAAQALPGPLFAIASYLGAMAAPQIPAIGASLATLVIFAPGLLLLTGALAFRERIMGSRRAARAMMGANAAVVGILAAALYDPLWRTAIIKPADAGVALAGGALLLILSPPPLAVVGLCVVASAALAGQ